MNEPIVQRDDFWGDFVNGLFFRPVWRTVQSEVEKTASASERVDAQPEDKTVSEKPQDNGPTEAFILVTEPIPGVDDSDIDLSVENGVLLISVPGIALGNRDRPSFSRRIPLPSEADTDSIRASYVDGVLTVRLPLRPSTTSAETLGPHHPSGVNPIRPFERDVKVAYGAALKDLTPQSRGAHTLAFNTWLTSLDLPTIAGPMGTSITQWRKRVGDRVEVDEPLVAVSTDRADLEIPSPMSGVIEEILVAEDETAEAGVPLVRIIPFADPSTGGSRVSRHDRREEDL